MMKKLLFISFLALSLFQACTKNEVQIGGEGIIPTLENQNFTCLGSGETEVLTNDCPEGWKCSFKVMPQSRIDINEYEGQASGGKNVFQMIYGNEGALGGLDYETTNILVFELDESQNSFFVQGGDLKDMRMHYRRMCHCNEVEFREVTLGCIEGARQRNGDWLIQGNLKVSYGFGDIEVKLDAHFAN